MAAGRRMGRKVTLACCALNQWALDFEGNLRRIKESESSEKIAPFPDLPFSFDTGRTGQWDGMRMRLIAHLALQKSSVLHASLFPRLFSVEGSSIK